MSQDNKIPKIPTLDFIYETFKNNEKNCISFFYQVGILKKNIKCCKCSGSYVVIKSKTNRQKTRYKYAYHLKCKDCEHENRITINSVVYNCKISFFKIILLLYFYATKIETNAAAVMGGLSLVVVQKYYKHFREAISKYMETNWFAKFKFDPRFPVEWDELAISAKRKYNRGSKKKKGGSNWVLMGSQRSTGLGLGRHIGNRQRDTMEPIICRYSQRGSTVYTDGLSSYNELGNLGIEVWSTPHARSFVNPKNPKAHTNQVESMNNQLRQWVSRYNGINSQKDDAIQIVLNEFWFFKNHKQHEKGLFKLVTLIVGQY